MKKTFIVLLTILFIAGTTACDGERDYSATVITKSPSTVTTTTTVEAVPITTQAPTVKTTKTTQTKKSTATRPTTMQNETSSKESVEVRVWIPKTGKKYHSKPNCGTMKNPSEVSLSEAEQRGYTPCKNCH
ncbi:MAG: hypothetical protein IKA63_06465 [Clostridia bacterium]|nr:hypothetical protein [Clostridia bacterium]